MGNEGVLCMYSLFVSEYILQFNSFRATEQYCATGAILKPLCLSKQLTLSSQQHISVSCLQTMFSCNTESYFALHVYCNNWLCPVKELNIAVCNSCFIAIISSTLHHLR